ncbi:MAG: hypothetical protein AB7F89_17995, partial [Pirellulaceae bacterium]
IIPISASSHHYPGHLRRSGPARSNCYHHAGKYHEGHEEHEVHSLSAMELHAFTFDSPEMTQFERDANPRRFDHAAPFRSERWHIGRIAITDRPVRSFVLILCSVV